MPVYNYEAVNEKGEEVKGKIEAESYLGAISRLHNLGYFPTRILEEKPREVSFFRTLFQDQAKLFLGRVKFQQLVSFTRQMATLIGAGLSILKSLRTIAEQPGLGPLKEIINRVADGVERGQPLSEGLVRYPRYFSRLYVNMVRAGESGGVLEKILKRLADFLESQMKLRSRVRNALIYPVFIIIVATGILSILLTWVVPIFVSLFADLGGALPLPTRLLMTTSSFFKTRWYFILLGILALVFLFRFFKQLPKGKYIVDNFKLHLPIFGNLYRNISIARFSRTLATLLGSGVPILPALNIVRETAGNEVIRRALGGVHDSIREGESIAQPLYQSGVFPALVVNMVRVGEESGTVDEMLYRIADNFDEEVERTVGGLTALLEPVLIIFMGLVVGFIVISMIMPLFSLIKLVS